MPSETTSPALLTRTELDWLAGTKVVSKSFEHKMKSQIKRKLQVFSSIELPLLKKYFGQNLPLVVRNYPFESQIPGSNPGRSILSSSPAFTLENAGLTNSRKATMLDRTTPPDWNGFRQYLANMQNAKVANDTLRYAKQHYHVLLGEAMEEVLQLSPGVQRHLMKAMSALSKYQGCYNRWKEIKEQYQLKWSRQDSLEDLQNIIDNKHNYSAMKDWLKEACAKIPKSYGDILIYATLTGLRAQEAIGSINLVKKEPEKYLKTSSMALEHYRYPDTFIRRTKKAYISVVSEGC